LKVAARQSLTVSQIACRLGRCLRGLARTDLERLAESLGALTGRVEAATARGPDADRPRTSRTYKRWGAAP
jgi:hypothetical protein